MATKKIKPSKQFVDEMEKMYPDGATITPAKKKTTPVKAPVKKKK